MINKTLAFSVLIYSCTAISGQIKEIKDASGNSNIYYQNDSRAFFIYPIDKTINQYSLPENAVSESGRYAIINRVVRSVEEINHSISEVNKCDIIDLSNGCIKYTISDDCDVHWDKDELHSDLNPITSTEQHNIFNNIEAPSPDKVSSVLSKVKNGEYYQSDILFMSGNTYASCYPVTHKNIIDMNNLGLIFIKK
jgi:hypothetical protein